MEQDQSNEKQFEKYILQQYTWESLPPEVKKRMGNTKDTWKHNVCRYSIRHQLRWKTNLVKQFITDEKAYYMEVLRFSKTQFMVCNPSQTSLNNQSHTRKALTCLFPSPFLARTKISHWRAALPLPHLRRVDKRIESATIQVLFGNDV